MNRIYRVIRSRTYNRDVVVSEITKTTGKSSSEVRTTARGNPAFRATLLGLVAAGLIASPTTLNASEITGLDGKSLITASDKVHNLYAQQINSSKATGAVGVSKYGKFNVTAGDIANMHFNKKGANLRFVNHTTGLKSSLKDAVIIELKQDGRADSQMKRILLNHRVKPTRMSKYCIGTTITNPNVKSNRFKKKIRRIEKVINSKIECYD